MTSVECWDDDPDFESDIDNISLFAHSLATTASANADGSSCSNASDNHKFLDAETIRQAQQADSHRRVEEWTRSFAENAKDFMLEEEDGFDFGDSDTENEHTLRFRNASFGKTKGETLTASSTLKGETLTPAGQSTRPRHSSTSSRLSKHNPLMGVRNVSDLQSIFTSSTASTVPGYESDFGDDSALDGLDFGDSDDIDLAEQLKKTQLKNAMAAASIGGKHANKSALAYQSSPSQADSAFWDEDFEIGDETVFTLKKPSNHSSKSHAPNQRHPYIVSTVSFQPKSPSKMYPSCKEVFPSLSYSSNSDTQQQLSTPPRTPPAFAEKRYFSKTRSHDAQMHSVSTVSGGTPYLQQIRSSSSSPSKGKHMTSSQKSSTWIQKDSKELPDSQAYLDFKTLRLAAVQSGFRTKPRKVRHWGDGNELDMLEDLPVDEQAEKRYTVEPVGRGAPRIAGAFKSSPDSSPTKRLSHTGTSQPSRVSFHHVQNALSSKKIAPRLASRKKESQSHKPHKQPTLIKNLNSPNVPRTVGEMRYNPAKKCWEGNDHSVRDFDAPSSPTRPALITNVSTKKGIHVVGNMVFDPTRMCWLHSSETSDEEDPFADFDDLQENEVSSSASNESRINFSYSLGNNASYSDVSEIFDVGPEFKRKQQTEEVVWRKWVDGWYLSSTHPTRAKLWELYDMLNAEH